MCGSCGKKSCNGGCSETSFADMQSQIDSMQAVVDALTSLTKFLNGHPILALENAEDILEFDLTTGKGSGNWIGWGVCDGTSYPGVSGNISTPNLLDRFLVGSQGNYVVGDTGGFDSITLITAEIPSHTHTLTDPGHTHIVTDPGHTHNVTDPGHTHVALTAAHTHTFTTDGVGDHSHSYERDDTAGTDYYLPELIATHQLDYSIISDQTGDAGAHSHTGTTDSATPITTITAAFTGIDMDTAFTGISNISNTTGITAGNTGGGTAHENRPPYYAVLFIKKIF